MCLVLVGLECVLRPDSKSLLVGYTIGKLYLAKKNIGGKGVGTRGRDLPVGVTIGLSVILTCISWSNMQSIGLYKFWGIKL